jgi:hypothetical protein
MACRPTTQAVNCFSSPEIFQSGARPSEVHADGSPRVRSIHWVWFITFKSSQLVSQFPNFSREVLDFRNLLVSYRFPSFRWLSSRTSQLSFSQVQNFATFSQTFPTYIEAKIFLLLEWKARELFFQYIPRWALIDLDTTNEREQSEMRAWWLVHQPWFPFETSAHAIILLVSVRLTWPVLLTPNNG